MQSVRETKAGTVSDPVRSKLGVHLIFLHAIEPGTRTFDDLTDQAAIRRDAADALFNALVASQSSAKVKWFVDDYQPR
jgi:parvulin-like peptidyl-prolyl isomerase